MFLAEVFVGSSTIWIIDAWSILITFPLYLGHLLFFLNLAIITKRTSLPQLYLWGVLFGLYESWITKVLWYGYPGSEGAILGLWGGIAILEFIVLVFFYHTIMAFILPILVFEIFIYSITKDDSNLLPGHLAYISKNSLFMKIFIIMALIAGSFLAINSGLNIFLTLIAGVSSFCIIIILNLLSKEKTIESITLGKVGFTLVIIYVLSLNIFMFFFLLPELIPTSYIPILIIIAVYAIVLLLLKLSKPNEGLSRVDIVEEDLMTTKKVYKIIAIFITLSVIYCFVPIIAFILFIIFTFGLLVIGPILFIVFTKKALKGE